MDLEKYYELSVVCTFVVKLTVFGVGHLSEPTGQKREKIVCLSNKIVDILATDF
jgi:hypothetical protein